MSFVLTLRPSPRFAPVITTTFPLCNNVVDDGLVAPYGFVCVVFVNAVELIKKSGGKGDIFVLKTGVVCYNKTVGNFDFLKTSFYRIDIKLKHEKRFSKLLWGLSNTCTTRLGLTETQTILWRHPLWRFNRCLTWGSNST